MIAMIKWLIKLALTLLTYGLYVAYVLSLADYSAEFERSEIDD